MGKTNQVQLSVTEDSVIMGRQGLLFMKAVDVGLLPFPSPPFLLSPLSVIAISLAIAAALKPELCYSETFWSRAV